MGRLVLGLSGTIDYEIVWDSAAVERLVESHGIEANEIGTAHPIRTERDLVRTVLGFLRDGTGGERFVASTGIVTSFASHFVKAVTLGGTPVRAAFAMAKLGVDAALHLVSIDDDVRRLLPPGCDYVCSARTDSTDPHLIVQFRAGDQVRVGDTTVVAPFPNRAIFANDPLSQELVLSPDLEPLLADASVFLISGFNVMRSAALVQQRVRELRQQMAALPSDALVIYEDSGFHVPALARETWEGLRGCVDVHSMNEDEMQGYLGRPLDLLDPDAAATGLAELGALVRAPTLVVHTKYWALALGHGAAAFAPALTGGITMASARYCYGDEFSLADHDRVAGLPASALGAGFADALQARMGTSLCCVAAHALPVERATTIGLGDTFVGGFIAALSGVRDDHRTRSASRSLPPRRRSPA